MVGVGETVVAPRALSMEMPTEDNKSSRNHLHASQLPQFSTDALERLATNIASKLKKPANGTVTQVPNAKPKKNRPEHVVNKRKLSNEAQAPKMNPAVQRNGTLPATKAVLTAPTSKSGQGKKRLRDGRVKVTGSVRKREDVNTVKLGHKPERTLLQEKSNIEDDIEALGGTKDDLELIADVPSDSEMEGNPSGFNGASGDSLTKELDKMVRRLGVDKAAQRETLKPPSSEEDETSQDTDMQVRNGKVPGLQEANGVNGDVQASKPSRKGQMLLAITPQSYWHASSLPPFTAAPEEVATLPHDLTDRIHAYAKSLLENDNKQYVAHTTSASSAHQFYSTIMSTGTLSDKISALTLSIQESPVHNMKALENLVGLARKRSRGQAVEVLGALKDLFGPGNLLPSDRKLRTFANQPALSVVFDPTDFHWTSNDPLPKQLKESHLILWAYEHWLKGIYFEVLKVIETWCNDEVVFARGKAVDYVCQLLKEKPEQEANLLRLLVNKLGDSDKKIASKASFNILQLETTHPLMKPIIISAIESDLIFRPGQSLHAKYYAIITLNQTVLSAKEEDVARKLLDIYFGLFIKLLEKPDPAKAALTGVNSITINKKGEVQGGGGAAGKKAQKRLAEKEKATTVDEDLKEKMLSAVLTGVNRAIPFTNTNDESFEKHLDTLFKVTHSSNFNTSIQALMLIQQLNGSHQGSVDRFYRTLYESLLDPRLLTSSKQALYLNLLFRALKADLDVKRVQAFAKRLLQVAAMHQPSFTCGILYLLRELEGVFPVLSIFIDQHTEASDEEEEDFHDVPESQDLPRPRPLPVLHRTKFAYDGRKRDPSHANASESSLWELTPFLTHYHPSVSLFANRLITHAPMPPKPDLSLNTLIHFLDRFVYRNPKATSTAKGASVMQGGDSSALLVSRYSEKDRSRAPVNSEAFWKMESEKIGADEVFFHKYFNTLGRGKEKLRKKKEERRRGEEASESEGDEDEIWKALVDSRPEVEGGSDGGMFSDDDIDMEDLEDDDDDEDLGKAGEGLADPDERDDAGGRSLVLGDENDEALFDSEAEVPSELEDAAFFGRELQSNKMKTEEKEDREKGEKGSKKRRRLKNLPTFASADDYAKMLGDEDGEQYD